MEYRYYEIPAGSPVLALLGDKWVQNYGRDIDYLHFHNHLEVGFCYYGEGTVTFKEDIPFDGNMFTVIPKNFPHTTTSAGDSVSYWEWLFIDADKFLREVYKDNPRMAQKVLDRVNRRAHFVRVQDKPQIGGTGAADHWMYAGKKRILSGRSERTDPGSSFTGGKVESGGSGKDRIRGGK